MGDTVETDVEQYLVLRDVTGRDYDFEAECWVDVIVAQANDIVYRFRGATYGCISPAGIACSRFGPLTNPFFEVPRDAILPIIVVAP
jgi:hypothetical protein